MKAIAQVFILFGLGLIGMIIAAISLYSAFAAHDWKNAISFMVMIFWGLAGAIGTILALEGARKIEEARRNR